jgi:transposase
MVITGLAAEGFAWIGTEEGRKVVGVQDLSTRLKIANPISEWKLPKELEQSAAQAAAASATGGKPAAAQNGVPQHGMTPSGAPPAPISLLGIAPAALPLHGLTLHGLRSGGASAHGSQAAKDAALAESVANAASSDSSAEEGKGKLGPHLKLLLRMVEDQPRAKIKDFYLALKDRGYSGSYDLVKKKIHAFRRELGRQAGATFLSTDTPHAQVEMAKLVLKGPGREVKAHLFTMVLGHSGRFYAEVIEGSDMGSFLQCHQNAFEFFGGVPTGVFYDPQESPTMRRLVGGFPFHLPVVDCGHHYGYAAQPTPAFAPWMKGRLKRPGKVLKKLFFAGYEFTTLEKANADMLEWVSKHGRQSELRDRREKNKERLSALPPVGFNFRGRRQFLRLRA